MVTKQTDNSAALIVYDFVKFSDKNTNAKLYGTQNSYHAKHEFHYSYIIEITKLFYYN